MKNIIGIIRSNEILYFIATSSLYLLYICVLGISAFPSFTLLRNTYHLTGSSPGAVLFCLIIGLSLYLFLICSLFFMGGITRMLTIGLKPGSYETGSITFFRWISFSGFHNISFRLILPWLLGSGLVKLYYRMMGAKIGKNVFINTMNIHDPYLLEIGDNVIIGGDAIITCHIFEGDQLILDKIKIGNNTLVGANSYLMPGVELGDNSRISVLALMKRGTKVLPGETVSALPAMGIRQISRIMRAGKRKSMEPKQ